MPPVAPPRAASLQAPAASKLYECKICKRAFANQDSTSIREPSESSKIYGCKLCKGLFTTHTRLREHCHKSHSTSFVCGLCNTAFPNEVSQGLHCIDSLPGWTWKPKPPDPSCGICKFTFPTAVGLHRHQRLTEHSYCKECNEYFIDETFTLRHYEDVVHATEFWCCDCLRGFGSSKALERHLNDKNHQRFACQLCPRRFGNQMPLDVHIVESHNARADVNRKIYSEAANACYICQRKFKNWGALQNHLGSLLHNPLSDLACVASTKCKARFTSPSALLSHLESGQCKSGITREEINNLVLSQDTQCLITGEIEGQKFLDNDHSSVGTMGALVDLSSQLESSDMPLNCCSRIVIPAFSRLTVNL